MTNFDYILEDWVDTNPYMDKWEKIRSKSLLGRIRYNRKFRPMARWARGLGKFTPYNNATMQRIEVTP